MKTNKIASHANGFTLLEILITMVVTTVVMSAAFMFYSKQQRQMLIQNEDARASQTLRVVHNILASEIRMAGFDPGGNLNASITAINNSASITFTRDGAGSTPTGALNTSLYSINAQNQLIVTTNGVAATISDDIEAICFAYAIDVDGDKITDRYQDGTAAADEHIIWAIDINGDNTLDVNLDSNNDGAIDVRDLGAVVNLPNGVIPGAPITVFSNGVNTVYANVPMTAIRMVRVWTLSRTAKGDEKYSNTTTYTVGNQVITPATDLNLFNDTLHMRLASTIIKCENLGL